MDELNRYLDPQVADELTLSDGMKSDIILAGNIWFISLFCRPNSFAEDTSVFRVTVEYTIEGYRCVKIKQQALPQFPE